MGLFRIAIIIVSLAVGWKVVSKLRTSSQGPIVEGHFHPDYKSVADTFRKNLESGKERGAALAVYRKGELVLDMWGGFADEEALQPWRQNTMAMAFSVGKMMGSIVIAKLVEKGLLEYEKPVSLYWPEFAQNNKQDITVEMLMSHQAALIALEPISVFDIRDNVEKVEELLVKKSPEWTPGTAVAYHMVTFGLYVEALARKVDPKHRSIAQIFDEEIAKPFDIDYHIGIPLEMNYRMARSCFPGEFEQFWLSVTSSLHSLKYYFLMKLFPTSASFRAMATLRDAFPLINPEVRAVGFTSGTAAGTARAIAKLMGILSSGGTYKGKQLLSAKLIKRLQTEVVRGFDPVMQVSIALGPGLFLKNTLNGHRLFGHPGLGGQLAFAESNNEIGFAYLTNYLGVHHIWEDERLLDVQNALYDSI